MLMTLSLKGSAPSRINVAKYSADSAVKLPEI
jgi:hypothetical protein